MCVILTYPSASVLWVRTSVSLSHFTPQHKQHNVHTPQAVITRRRYPSHKHMWNCVHSFERRPQSMASFHCIVSYMYAVCNANGGYSNNKIGVCVSIIFCASRRWKCTKSIIEPLSPTGRHDLGILQCKPRPQFGRAQGPQRFCPKQSREIIKWHFVSIQRYYSSGIVCVCL